MVTYVARSRHGAWRAPVVMLLQAAFVGQTRGLVPGVVYPLPRRPAHSGGRSLCTGPLGSGGRARGAVTRWLSTAVEQEAALVRQQEQGRKRSEGLQQAGLAGAVKLNYVEVASDKPEEACPVLILHGLLGSARNFASFSKSLSDELQIPRRIIMPDLRNHGDSTHANSMGYVNMAADIKALLEELEIDRCCVIGHSMGGKAAACLALLFPDMVESVAILDIAPVSYTGQNGPSSSKTWMEINSIIKALHEMPVSTYETRKQADADLARTIEDPVLRSFALTNLVPDREGGGMKWRIGIKSISRNMGIIGGFDLGQGLQRPASDLGLKFERDAFFIQGGASSFIRSTHLPEIGKLFPRFVLQTMRNAGHWVHSEDPEATIRNVQRFLDRENPTPF